MKPNIEITKRPAVVESATSDFQVVAEADLTIKGRTQRIAFPFTWKATPSGATLDARVTLDRLAFGLAAASHGLDSRRDMLEHGGAPASELAWELTWQAAVTPWLMLQPDLQIVHHPGAEATRPTATVFGLRTIVTY